MSNNEIKIKNGKSSLAQFVKKPLPTDKEEEDFEKFVTSEAREEEIKDSLSEIYHDDDGKIVNVRKLEIKKRRGFFFWLISFIFTAFIITGSVYAIYKYLYPKLSASTSPVDLTISGEKEIIPGKETFYTVEYKNNDKVAIQDIEIRLGLPDNFILLDSEPAMSQKNFIWDFLSLGPHRSDTIKIKGKLIGEELSTVIVLADMIYTPENFSSQFKKSASFETSISKTGLDISFINSSSALVGEENNLIIKYKAEEDSFINNFRLTIEPSDNIDFIRPDLKATSSRATTSQAILTPNSWLVDKIDQSEKELAIKFKVNKKKTDQQDLILDFDTAVTEATSTNYYLFLKKTLTFEVIKSNLNLNLIINGSTADQGVDFGQALNYSLVYANKGETTMKDVIIMAVLESDWLDWQTLKDDNHGIINGNTLSWSKNEIPLLAELTKNTEGTIDFSIKVKPLIQIDLSKSYQIKSYLQYNIGNKPVEQSDDNRSNIIINKINSDLTLKEQVRYFNDDNLAVGSGPLPPKVGETTSLKVYLNITNNLHELTDAVVTVTLPNYVGWDDKNQTSVGNIDYDNQNRVVRWQIGRLPTTINQTQAEFNISITPSETDRNKILVLLPNTMVSAIDNETKASITKQLTAKTTKLEDDPIAASAGNDGIVQ